MRSDRNRSLEQMHRMRGAGGPQFDADFVVYARKLALLGLPRHEIARNLGASRHEFEQWCNQYPEFRQALDAGAVLSDFDVVEALKKRATGFKVTRTVVRDGVERKHEDYFPPDVSAIQTWLYNRQPEHWRPIGKIEPLAPAQTDLNARPVEFPMKAPEAIAHTEAPPAAAPVVKKDAESRAA